MFKTLKRVVSIKTPALKLRHVSNGTFFATQDNQVEQRWAKDIFDELSPLTICEQTAKFINAPCYGPREMHFRAVVQSLENKKNPNSVNFNEDTALHLLGKIASQYPCSNQNENGYGVYVDLVDALLEAGANPELLNKDRKTPAHLYFEGLVGTGLFANRAEKSFETIIKKLLDTMRDVHQVDNQGWNLLHHAVYSQRPDLVAFFLNKGISPMDTTSLGMRPMDLAIYTRNEPICGMLMDACNSIKSIYHTGLLVDNQPVTDVVTPKFFSSMAVLLRKKNRWEYGDGWNHIGRSGLDTYYLPVRNVLDKSCSSPVEKALRELYLPINWKTPMALAIELHDIKKIIGLLAQGWNAYLEHAVNYNKAEYFYHALDKIYSKNNSSYGLFTTKADTSDYLTILEYLVQSPCSGVTIESEFDRLVNAHHGQVYIRKSQVLTLFDLGITAESFSQHMGTSLQKAISWLTCFCGERANPDLGDLAATLESRLTPLNSTSKL
ncbi:MAG: ankyrin repeat domain-containing protein [Legionellales bacterium]